MAGRWVIYPEEGYWDEERLRTRLYDVLVDSGDDETDPRTLPLDEVCQILEDTGKVTFYRDNGEERDFDHNAPIDCEI